MNRVTDWIYKFIRKRFTMWGTEAAWTDIYMYLNRLILSVLQLRWLKSVMLIYILILYSIIFFWVCCLYAICELIEYISIMMFVNQNFKQRSKQQWKLESLFQKANLFPRIFYKVLTVIKALTIGSIKLSRKAYSILHWEKSINQCILEQWEKLCS